MESADGARNFLQQLRRRTWGTKQLAKRIHSYNKRMKFINCNSQQEIRSEFSEKY